MASRQSTVVPSKAKTRRASALPHRARWAAPALVLTCLAGCAGPRTVAPSVGADAVTEAPAGGEPAFADVEASSEVPSDADDAVLASSIKKVTVYSDRALVTREAQADVSTEPTVFTFQRLPGWVDDGSVRVAVSAGRILDVRVERTYLARATDETYKKAEARHRELTNQLAALSDELQILDAQQAQIESIRAFSMDKITGDLTVGNISVDSYGSVVKFVSDSLRSTAKDRRAATLERDLLLPELEASQRTLDELQSLMRLEETTVQVSMVASQPTTSTIELTYMLPGATWEPMHELRASTSDDRSVDVASFAVVTQSTGEDWENAEIAFSTQSSTESVRIPELEALTLGDVGSTSRTVTSRVSSFQRAEQAYAGQNELWNKVHQKALYGSENFEEVYQANMEVLQVTQSRTVQIFQGLQHRGTTAHFTAGGVKTVRGDGRPVRLRIGQSALQSTQRIVAVPEQSLNAARTLQMTNTSAQALLPGRVALYQDGAFLGMTDVDFIADGEAFSLFLSVADHVKLSRTLDRKRSSLVRKKVNRMQVAFVVEVQNLSDAATSVALADRIPVSENKEIRVTDVKISPAEAPDSQGLLSWSVSLSPKETRRFEISYTVEYPPTLVLETRRNRESTPAGSSPMRSRRGIEEQLMDLEEAF